MTKEEELIFEYMKNGGKSIHFESINMLRDGGTIVAPFYYIGINGRENAELRIDKDNGDFKFNGRVLDKEKDAATICYVKSRLKRLKETYEFNIRLINKHI